MIKTIAMSLVGVIFTFTNFSNNHNKKNDKLNKVKIIYVYDAICGWCFGFSPTIGNTDETDHPKPEQTDHLFCWRRS